VHRRPVAHGDVGRGGKSRQTGKQKGELAIDVVGKIADDLLEAAVHVGLLRLPIALKQDGGEGERGHDQTGAEQEEQQGDAEAAPARWPYLASTLRYPVAPSVNPLLASA
jgi:hypothetical protein